MTERIGIDHELWFCRCWLERHGTAYEQPRGLSRFFEPFLVRPSMVIANLGSGAVNLIGDRSPSTDVSVVSSDLLADRYRAICEELGLRPFASIAVEDMTRLSYADDTFDVVYCGNAIDHSADAPAALREMVRVCKPGGVVVLKHFAHEGKRLRYSGMHAWNVDVVGDDCEIWNRNRDVVFRCSSLGLAFTHSADRKRVTTWARKAA